MKEFFNETLPNLVKCVIVIAITVFGAIQIAPPIVPGLNIDTPLGMVYLVPAIIAVGVGLLLNRVVNGIVSLLVLAGIAFGLSFFSVEIHSLMAQYSKKNTVKTQATVNTAPAQ